MSREAASQQGSQEKWVAPMAQAWHLPGPSPPGTKILTLLEKDSCHCTPGYWEEPQWLEEGETPLCPQRGAERSPCTQRGAEPLRTSTHNAGTWATWAWGWPRKWTSHHHTSRPAGLSILGTGEVRAWGAVLVEEKGLELKVEQEQWGTPSAEPTPPQVQGYARGDWSQCSADGNHGYRTQASCTPHQTDLTCTYMQTGICTHICMWTCTCTHIHACVCMHTKKNLYSCMRTQTYTHVNVCGHIHIHVCAHVYMHVCVHTCAYIMNTHAHMHKQTCAHACTHIGIYTYNMHRCVVHSHELKCTFIHVCTHACVHYTHA